MQSKLIFHLICNKWCINFTALKFINKLLYFIFSFQFIIFHIYQVFFCVTQENCEIEILTKTFYISSTIHTILFTLKYVYRRTEVSFLYLSLTGVHCCWWYAEQVRTCLTDCTVCVCWWTFYCASTWLCMWHPLSNCPQCFLRILERIPYDQFHTQYS